MSFKITSKDISELEVDLNICLSDEQCGSYLLVETKTFYDLKIPIH